MAAVVKLDAIVEAMDSPPDWEVYLDPETGELISITEDDHVYLDREGPDPDDLADWERDALARARRALESETMLELPGQHDIHEWEIMRRFALGQKDPASRELEHAIHGGGAFRKFRAAVHRLDLRDAWYAYRSAAIEAIAREWLESNGVEYED